jgi:hypothetical protein
MPILWKQIVVGGVVNVLPGTAVLLQLYLLEEEATALWPEPIVKLSDRAVSHPTRGSN